MRHWLDLSTANMAVNQTVKGTMVIKTYMFRKMLTGKHTTTVLPLANNAATATKLFTIFCLGFSSGLPFLLLLSTFSVWLTEAGMSKTQIGMFAWVTICYTGKFLLAPLVDNIRVPLLSALLGQRRSWMLLAQLALVVALFCLGQLEPRHDLLLLAVAAFFVGLFSALQDIVIEAYRIEILPPAQIGAGASVSVLGYRLGMLCSGAGAIYLAAYFDSWAMAYTGMAVCMLVGISTTLFASEPPSIAPLIQLKYSRNLWRNIFITPVAVWAKNQQWLTIILFILCYKFADTVLNVMSMPFLLEIGFNKIEIAHVAKSFGIIAMLCGGVIGGIFLRYYCLWRLLVLASVLQFFAASLFVLQAHIGYHLPLLFVTMGVENFTCGFAQVALISYLSLLCSPGYIAVHYALLTSFASFVRVNFSVMAGWLADNLLWSDFYSLVCVSCIFSMLMLRFCSLHFAAYKSEVTSKRGVNT